ncbi:MAG: hypothetical protein EOO50_16820 [Flavobacterium sp.]|uniref:hypothetical protein n=1 Tax=Flavobacterium sp. TaxID=239 RepID=UPI0011F95593|nr:hypothetical protein [Flavobacterium sp.]RZJ63372.1 MAG: hypothetical protein EOO50_16820 [Flavobacterium sp.]
MKILFVLLFATWFASAQDCPKGFRKFSPQILKGDFDGDGKPDEIKTHLYSELDKNEPECVADAHEMEFDSVADWYSKKATQLYLSLNEKENLTLNFGYADMLYCLINLGNIDKQGGDEIALSIAYFDFSNVNSCRIYSFCSGQWVLRKQFSIHEDSFTYASDDPAPTFAEIRGFLEKRNGIWRFSDYHESDLTLDVPYEKMSALKLKRCR